MVLEPTLQVQMTDTVLPTVAEARRYQSRIPHAGEFWLRFQNARICQGTFYPIHPTLPRLVWPSRDSRVGQFSLACYSYPHQSNGEWMLMCASLLLSPPCTTFGETCICRECMLATHAWSLEVAGPSFNTSVACSFPDVQEAARHVSSN